MNSQVTKVEALNYVRYAKEVLGVNYVPNEQNQHQTAVAFLRLKNSRSLNDPAVSELFQKIKDAMKLDPMSIVVCEEESVDVLVTKFETSASKVIFLLGDQTSIALNCKKFEIKNDKMILSTNDPVDILNDQSQKRPFWEDLKKGLEHLNK